MQNLKKLHFETQTLMKNHYALNNEYPSPMIKIYTALNKEKAEFNYIISLPNYIIFAKIIKLNFHPQKWKFSEKVNEKWKFTENLPRNI